MAEEAPRSKISLTTSGSICKTILEPGNGKAPLKGFTVTVEYDILVGDKVVWAGKRPYSFELDCNQVIRALDTAVASMLPGEKALVTAFSRAAFGDAGYPPFVAPKTDISMNVKLLSATPPKMQYKSIEEVINLVDAQRKKGNEYVTEKNWSMAVEHYHEGLQVLDHVSNAVPGPDTLAVKAEDTPALNKARVSLYSNLGHAYAKQREYASSLSYCQKALELDKTLVKVWYRAGLALSNLGQTSRAIEVLAEAHELFPDNDDITNELQRLRDLPADRALYGGMFNRP